MVKGDEGKVIVYQVEYLNTALGDAKGIGERELKNIQARITWLAQNAERIIHHPLEGKRFRNKYRLRVGDYRVIYSLHHQNNTIVIELIGHRSKIYRER